MKRREIIDRIMTVRNNFGNTLLKNGPVSFMSINLKIVGATIETCIIIIPIMIPDSKTGK
jgi:hypothetical protein